MEYRKATTSDIPCLIDFRKRLLVEEGQSPDFSIDKVLQKYFERCFSEDSSVQYIAVDNNVAVHNTENNNEIVGTGGVHFYLYPPSYKNPTGKIAYISSMYTVPNFRRRGIAKNLLSLLIKQIEERGCSFVRLQASEQGYPVYRKYGFNDADGFMVLRLP